MDPKQTEGQKSGPMPQAQGGFSFQTGQLNSVPNASSTAAGTTPANTLSTGANIARTMDNLNMGDRKSATSNSPFAKHHFNKVAPQTGDIIIEQSDKKSNGLFFKKVKNPAGSSIVSGSDTGGAFNRGRLIQFGLIFGGIALVGLVIFTVVMLINQPKKSDSGDGSSDVVATGDPEELFDEYLQKLITGEVGKTKYEGSDGKTYTLLEVLQAVIGKGEIGNNILYADQIINSGMARNNTYIGELNDLYDSFATSYQGNSIDAIGQISYYYYNFANIQPVVDIDIINAYQDDGYEQTVNAINETYIFYDDRGLNDFSDYSRSYALAILDLVNDAKNNLGCTITDSKTASECSTLSSLDSYQTYIDALSAYYDTASRIRQDARNEALEVIGTVYEELIAMSAENTDEGSDNDEE